MDDEAGPEETKKPMTSAMVSEVRFLCSWAGLARESSSSKQRSQEQRTKCSTGRELERGRDGVGDVVQVASPQSEHLRERSGYLRTQISKK